MASQQFSLKWNNHTSNMLSIFENLLTNETFVDVTLACDGLSLKAHKMVLSACSAYFHSLFLENPCKHPIVIMKDVAYKDLKAIIDFMYHGEVNVSQDQLSALLKTAETLKVKGLTEVSGNQERDSGQQAAPPPPINVPVPAASSTPQPSLPNISDSTPMRAKRKRVRSRRRSSDSGGSDDEIVPTKIKEPNSPDIEEVIEESSGVDDSIHRRGMTNAPRSSRHSSHASFSSKRHSSSNAQVHDPTSGEDDVEPSKLLVQTLTTESSIPAGAVSSSNASLPLGTGIEISQVSDNQALVPVSAMSDSMGSSHFQGPDSPQDVKPVITFEDQIPGTSQSAMFLDQSSMPGPSGYEDNSMVSQEGQSQGFENNMPNFGILPSTFRLMSVQPLASYKEFRCDVCHKDFTTAYTLRRHKAIHNPNFKTHKCVVCHRNFNWKDNLKAHMLCVHGRRYEEQNFSSPPPTPKKK